MQTEDGKPYGQNERYWFVLIAKPMGFNYGNLRMFKPEERWYNPFLSPETPEVKIFKCPIEAHKYADAKRPIDYKKLLDDGLKSLTASQIRTEYERMKAIYKWK